MLDHYLEVLRGKPGALPGSTALATARATGAFTSAHEAFWAAARKVNGDADGTRELIDVLLLHRSMPAQAVVAGIAAALRVGRCPRKSSLSKPGATTPAPPRVGPARTVISLPNRAQASSGLSR